MRNQYKILAEKYNLVEGKKEIMAGLEELTFSPDDPITVSNLLKAGFVQRIATRGSNPTFNRPDDKPYIVVWRDYFKDTWYVDTTAEFFTTVYTPKTMGELEADYNKIAQEVKKSKVQEEGKKEIMAGLETLAFNPDEPIAFDNVWKLDFESVGAHQGGHLFEKSIKTRKGDVGIYLSYNRFTNSIPVWQVSCETANTVNIVTTLGQVQKAYDLIVSRLKDSGYFEPQPLYRPFNA